MPYSNISVVMTPAQKTAINDAQEAVAANLAFAPNLTPEEREALTSVAARRFSFVTKCMEYGTSNTQYVSPYQSFPEMQKDFNLTNDVRPMRAKEAKNLQMMDDIIAAASSELYKACLDYYKNVQRASRQNVPGATAIYNDLKELFQGMGNTNSQEPPESDV